MTKYSPCTSSVFFSLRSIVCWLIGFAVAQIFSFVNWWTCFERLSDAFSHFLWFLWHQICLRVHPIFIMIFVKKNACRPKIHFITLHIHYRNFVAIFSNLSNSFGSLWTKTHDNWICSFMASKFTRLQLQRVFGMHQIDFQFNYLKSIIKTLSTMIKNIQRQKLGEIRRTFKAFRIV